MNRKILVPLDGSELAECVLPHVIKMVRNDHIDEVILFYVIETPAKCEVQGFSSSALRDAFYRSAHEYLSGIQANLSGERVVVTQEIQEGNIVTSIIEYTKKNAVDLFAITTQGFSHLRRMALGHVALKLLQDSHVPLLMIKPQANRKLN